MRAMAIAGFGGPERLQEMSLPRPKPGRGEILIRSVAAGVNPVDWKIREGYLADVLPHDFPVILGWDVAGIVEELGEGTSRFRKGDKVFAYARKPVVQWGTWAECVAVAETAAALLPPRLLFEEAAAVPLAALTAHQALARAGLGSGETLLVLAAAGGVGHFAVQLGKEAGARVYGTAGTSNQQFVLGLGAAGAIDYTREDFREALRRFCAEGVDVVLDGVGGETAVAGFDALRPGGRLVSIVDPSVAEQAPRGTRAEFHFVEPSGEQLEWIAGLFARHKLTTHVSRIYPLREAARALAESQAGHVRGKLALAL